MAKKRTLPAEPPKARNLEEAQHLIDELWAQLVEKKPAGEPEFHKLLAAPFQRWAGETQ